METRRRTWFDERGLTTADGARAVYAAGVHYARLAPARWRGVLGRVRDLGFTAVSAPVAWREHEPTAGAFAWSGALDVGQFAAIARELGLAVVLRVGPVVDAEHTAWGLPDHVIAAHAGPRVAPVPPRAFPLPDYADPAFLARVRGWYAAIAAQVVPDAIGIDRAPGAWRDGGGAVTTAALAALAGLLDEAGFAGIARFADLPLGLEAELDARAVAAAIGGPVGLTAAAGRGGFRALRRRVAAQVGYHVASEVHVGRPVWWPPPADDADADRDRVLSLLAAGARGFDVATAVARDRYVGAPLAADGALGKSASWLRPLLATLGEVGWHTLVRPPVIALVDDRTDAAYGRATCVLDGLPAPLAALLGGPALGTDAGARTAHRWHGALATALERAQLAYAIVDPAIPADELAGYAAVIAPTLERVDHRLWAALHALADRPAPRPTIVIGPGAPTRDERDQPLASPAAPRRIGRLEAALIDDPAGLAAALASLVPPPVWRIDGDPRGEVHAAAHARADGTTAVVFAVSDAAEARTVAICGDATTRELRDAITGERIPLVDGRATLAVPAGGVRMFVAV